MSDVESEQSECHEEEFPELEMACFGSEPRFTARELSGRAAADEGDADAVTGAESSFEQYLWPPQGRVGNTRWCECSSCKPMLVRLDCICCHEAKLFVKCGKTQCDLCHCEADEFCAVVLHPAVLRRIYLGSLHMHMCRAPCFVLIFKVIFERRKNRFQWMRSDDNRYENSLQ